MTTFHKMLLLTIIMIYGNFSIEVRAEMTYSQNSLTGDVYMYNEELFLHDMLAIRPADEEFTKHDLNSYSERHKSVFHVLLQDAHGKLAVNEFHR